MSLEHLGNPHRHTAAAMRPPRAPARGHPNQPPHRSTAASADRLRPRRQHRAHPL